MFELQFDRILSKTLYTKIIACFILFSQTILLALEKDDSRTKTLCSFKKQNKNETRKNATRSSYCVQSMTEICILVAFAYNSRWD